MGQIGKRLNYPLKHLIPQLIEKQCQNDWSGKVKHQIQNRQNNSITEESPKPHTGKEALEMFKAHPLAAEKTPGYRIVLKSEKDTPHGFIHKQGVIENTRN
jgi:hypothetical protein